MPSVIIIGAGPAGSLAAVLLARAGFTVDLFEQHSFPRDKVCGECLSALGIQTLQDAGVHTAVQGLQPALLSRTLIHPTNGPTVDVPLPAAMWGVSRWAMDPALLTEARNAGAVVHSSARCEEWTFGDPIKIRWRDLDSNRLAVHTADWLILADGKGALNGKAPVPTGDMGIKTHFSQVAGPRDAIELFAGHHHYGGLAAIENGHWNAAFSVPAGMLKAWRGDIDLMFKSIVAQSPMLTARLTGASRVSSWLAAPLPRFAVQKDWPVHVIPIGNAAAALEPVGGEGMGLALRSAYLASTALISAAGGDLSLLRGLPNQFTRLWRTRRAVCRGIARLFSNPALGDAIAPLMHRNPAITQRMLHWAGKAGG